MLELPLRCHVVHRLEDRPLQVVKLLHRATLPGNGKRSIEQICLYGVSILL